MSSDLFMYALRALEQRWLLRILGLWQFFFFFTHPIRSNKSAGPSDCLLAIDWISVALQGLALVMETRIKRKPR